METGPWQSVEACLAALSGILDAGGYARADAYAYIYGRLEVRMLAHNTTTHAGRPPSISPEPHNHACA